MSPRQQRLAELYKAREGIDKRIAGMLGSDAGSPMPATLAPPATGPSEPTWQEVAHANQRILWEMTRALRARHVSHAPIMRGEAA